MTRREKMQRAIESARAAAPVPKVAPKAASDATGAGSGAAPKAAPEGPQKPPKVKRTSAARDARARARGRLPDRSSFKVEYDAQSATWVGSLVVPVGGDFFHGLELRHRADGVFRLLEEIDAFYWELIGKLAQGEPHPAGKVEVPRE